MEICYPDRISSGSSIALHCKNACVPLLLYIKPALSLARPVLTFRYEGSIALAFLLKIDDWSTWEDPTLVLQECRGSGRISHMPQFSIMSTGRASGNDYSFFSNLRLSSPKLRCCLGHLAVKHSLPDEDQLSPSYWVYFTPLGSLQNWCPQEILQQP